MASSSDLIAIGDEVMADLLKLVSGGDDGWEDLWSDDGIVFHTRKGVEPCTIDIIRCQTTLKNTNIAMVKALLSPWLPYRLQWDDILQKCDTLEQFDNGYRLVHHVTKKKFPLSARDSVDIISTKHEPNRILIAARSVPTSVPPPTIDVVRTYQHLGGYCICRSEANSVEFSMYFQCDLNVKVPLFVQKLVDRAKPRFMCDKMKALRKALTTIRIDPAHIERL